MKPSFRAAFLAVLAGTLLLTACDRTRPYVAPGADPTASVGSERQPAPPAATPEGLQAQPPTRTPRGWRFTYADRSASSVHLAGTFNDWSTSAAPLTKGEEGIWTAVLDLDPGTYQYKFVVNGTDWKPDPTNPEKADDGYGGVNSVVAVP